MVFSRFRIQIALRILLLTLILALEAYVIFQTDWLMSKILLGVFAAFSLIELVRYVEKTNRDLTIFIQSILHRDFTANFSSGDRGPTDDALKEAFNDIVHEFRQLQAEKESHYEYLQTVIENIGVALICFNDQEEVILMNQAAKDLLAKPYVKKIRSLERVDQQLPDVFRRLESGGKELVKVVVNDELLQIAIAATEFKMMGTYYKLLSLQDIRSELDSREIDAWQKLIRVLTHEIMNSITPLSTLSGVLKEYVQDEAGKPLAPGEIDQEAIEDISLGLDTIESRTRGLLKFVKAYRSILKIPKPNFREVIVQDILSRISVLLRSELAERNIELRVRFPDQPLEIQADPELIEQILINLVRNAMEALSDQPNGIIEMEALQPRPTRTLIRIKDNGTGIEEEYADKIFVPFFTTKKEGTGIGLSLSRQIMRLHKGSITMKTALGEGTIFTLEF